MKQEAEGKERFRKRNSLFGKLSRVLFAVVLASVLTLSYALYTLYGQVLAKIHQAVSWNLAEELKTELQPLVSPSFQEEKLEEEAVRLLRYNKRIGIFLLHEDGQMIFSYCPVVSPRISMEPVRRFISTKGYPFWPILGEDPEDLLHRDKVPISAARILIEGQPGYLYLTLDNAFSRTTSQMLGDFMLFFASATLVAGVAVVALAFGMLLVRLLTRRFSELTDAIRRFTGGDYSVRVSSAENDEIGIHADAFNAMAGAIEENIRRLKENDKLRREFIVNISHDLRTPLGAMLSLLETMQTKFSRFTPEEQMKFLDRALSNCVRLNLLVDDLFELSQLNARTDNIDARPIDVGHILLSVAERLEAKAEEKDLRLVLELDETLPDVPGDAKMIDRAVSNLIENAVRYSAGPGTIRASGRCTPSGGIEISVADTGQGIPPSDLPHIFDRFFRGRQAGGQDKEGSGLGLAIVKRVIELHHSSILVESEAGKGTTFRFSLQAALPPAGPCPEAGAAVSAAGQRAADKVSDSQ